MFVRLFKKDGSYVDGELVYTSLGEEVREEDGAKVQRYQMTFTEGLPQGILPTHAMRMEWEEGSEGGGV